MSNNVRRQVRQRKERTARRLRRARRGGDSGRPVLSASRPRVEVASRTSATSYGGIIAAHRVAVSTGLVRLINQNLVLLKLRNPYHESDHVLNFAYNALCGGQCLDDIEHRRNDEAYLDALGATAIPDPTTAGDFCRRFESDDVDRLQAAINEARVAVWKQQPRGFSSRRRLASIPMRRSSAPPASARAAWGCRSRASGATRRC